MEESVVVCELPNEHIYAFEGMVRSENIGRPLPLGPENLLLRGSSLRNTKEVLGLVMYTGHETKELMNINQSRYKQSRLEKQTNRSVFIIIGFLAVLTSVASTYNVLWQ